MSYEVRAHPANATIVKSVVYSRLGALDGAGILDPAIS